MTVEDKDCLLKRDHPNLKLLEKAMIVNGSFGTTDDESKVNHHLSRYMADSGDTNNRCVLLSALFPKRKHLSDRFSYAIRRGWLLPIAWVHRLLRIVFIKELRNNAGLMVRLKDDGALQDRYRLMEAFGLTDIEDEHNEP